VPGVSGGGVEMIVWRGRVLEISVAVCSLVACAGPPDGTAPDADGEASDYRDLLLPLEHDLVKGSREPAVRAVHAYLRRYGYFPNATLADGFPLWRPVVDVEPAEEERFDEQTELAVRAFQRNLGLPVTGMLDEATRDVMKQSRCGVPDGVEELDPSNKYALHANTWTIDPVTYRVINGHGPYTASQLNNATDNAVGPWHFPTLEKRTSGSVDIRVQFSAQNATGQPFGPAVTGTGYSPPDGDIYLNSNLVWAINVGDPNAYGFPRAVQHYVGHAMGILHSALSSSVMYPTITPGMGSRTNLVADDDSARFAKYPNWYHIDSVSADIDEDEAEVFVTAEPAIAGGLTVWKKNFFEGWSILSGQGAERIAAKAGQVWIVQDDGDTYRWVSNAWQKVSGCSTDIAVGHDGSVWKITCTVHSGGFRIAKWNGSGWTETSSGGAVRISVGPKVPGGSTNVPWIVQDDGDVYRRTGSSATSGGWGSPLSSLPASNGCPSVGSYTATDIAVNEGGNMWAIGTHAVSGGYRILAWSEQVAVEGAAAVCRFHILPAGAVNIGVGGSTPSFVDDAGNAYSFLW
jgi:peptidoglycan hydrolase-like protein with peptidoglycan-binding domain